MSIEDFKDKYCEDCASKCECKLVLNIEKNAQCINYEKQNSKK